MWTRTRVSERLGTKYPIVQGPFGGGLSSAALVAAVSNAGGLGSFGANLLDPLPIRETVREIRALTAAPFAMNLWVPLEGEETQEFTPEAFAAGVRRLAPFYERLGVAPPAYPIRPAPRFQDQVEALLDAAPPVMSFLFGIPGSAILAECRRRGIVTLGTATNAEEAVALEAAGMDLVVASGSEAGGHRASFLGDPLESPGLAALVPQAADRVAIPVIAAGGIADGRGIVSAFALGAEGVVAGTVFVACDESGASAAYRAALRSEAARHTALTKAFSGRYGRGIKNRFLAEMKPYEADLPPYPFQNGLTRPLRQAAAAAGDPDYLSLWAGQNAARVRFTNAAEVMRFLVEDTERVFEKLRSEQGRRGDTEQAPA